MSKLGNTIFHSRFDRANTEFNFDCADCGSPDSEWVSLNLAVLLCDRCSYHHRCMGRHISYVLNLNYSPILNFYFLKYLYDMVDLESHNVWENNSARSIDCAALKKKRSVKNMFIYKKYVCKEFYSCGCVNPHDYKKFLQAVSDKNLLLVFHYLIAGADPNFQWIDGSTAAHTAVKVEASNILCLLVLWGADLSIKDGNELSVLQRAESGTREFLQTVYYLTYEITDAFSLYLFSMQPDHRRSCHLYVGSLPKISKDLSVDASTITKSLNEMELDSVQLLAQDIFDELHRRNINYIIDKMFFTDFSKVLKIECLTEYPEYSTSRNELRTLLSVMEEPNFIFLTYHVLQKLVEFDKKYSTSPCQVIIESEFTGDKNEIPVIPVPWKGVRTTKREASSPNQESTRPVVLGTPSSTGKSQQRSQINHSETWLTRFTSSLSNFSKEIKLFKRAIESNAFINLTQIVFDILSQCKELNEVIKEKPQLKPFRKELINCAKEINCAVSDHDLMNSNPEQFKLKCSESLRELIGTIKKISKANLE